MSGNSWVGKHKDELMTAAALGTIGVATGGFGLAGLLGGGAAATGAGTLGASAVPGTGLLGAGLGGAAGTLGASVAPGAGIAGAGLGSSIGASAGLLPTLQHGLSTAMGGPENYAAMTKGLSGLGRGAAMASAMGAGQQPQMPQMAGGMRQGPQMAAPGIASFAQMYGPVMDEEQKRRMMMAGYM